MLPRGPALFTANAAYAEDHGDFQDQITWLGLVGPCVKHRGATGFIFSDHTYVRPTVLALGLTDDY